jgi:hypothetical protein
MDRANLILCPVCDRLVIHDARDFVLREFFAHDTAFALLGCRGCVNAVSWVCDRIPIETGVRLPMPVLAAKVAQLLRRMIATGELTA